MTNCLQRCLRKYFWFPPDFIDKYWGDWRYHFFEYMKKKGYEVEIQPGITKSDGIALFWREIKSKCHAVVITNGEITHNPGNLKLEGLRYYMEFKKLK